MKRIFFILMVLVCFNKLSAQTDCVDYDVASYPKTIGGISYAWNGTAWNFSNLRQKKISGLDFGNSFFKGLLQYLPADYDPANPSIKHPLIIFFHGGASAGNGTAADLCRLFKDKGLDLATHKSLPGRIEREPELFTQTYLTQTYEYLVISPQFTVYKRAYDPNTGVPAPDNNYPSADEVEKVINYLVDTAYANKIDKRRIYLVGYSTGANMIMEYVGSNVDRAKRVAAVMPVSLCSQLYHPSNISIGVTASNIAQANLKTWFVYCKVDNCGFGQALNVPQTWDSAIKAAGGATPRLTMLTRGGAIGAGMEGLYNCSDTLAHDAWSRAFDPNFIASFTGDGGIANANDGINLNMYQWFTQQLNAVPPITLKSFTARLINNRVELKWTTIDEKDNASFTIERAGTDLQFISMATIPGSKDNPGEKEYLFTDNTPLIGLGFYRLVQTDIDGKRTYLGIRKIFNQKGNVQEVMVYPNPFSSGLSVFVSLQSSQNVFLSLTDMSGKVIWKLNGAYARGSSELPIPSHDLAKGIYFLKIEGTDFNVTRKIVKQ